MKSISRFILFKLLGWKIINGFPEDLDKYIIIAAPHTSNWDFPIGILVKFSEGLPIKFIGKHTLFKPPFGFIFRALGGTPVDRSKSKNVVQGLIDIFNSQDRFIFALSPEGTRKKVSTWKTGFYHVAQGANIPVVMATLDFGKKQVLINKPYTLTNDMEKDFLYFHEFFKDVKGKIPENFDPNFHLNLKL
ncbi:MAG: lysophospholipid acyltransferase family protein [Flavobacteriaceae bacterium]|nr:MAG: lysophospholipid acyltransferase family protein [Flavobacteriaceae bacterium]